MNRWHIDGESIVWDVADAHTDDLEMSGLGVSYIINYGSEPDGTLFLSRHCVFPTLRTIPNNTHASYQYDIDNNKLPAITADGQPLTERSVRFTIDGALTAQSVSADGRVSVKRVFYPSADKLRAYESVTLTNISGDAIDIGITGEQVTLNCFARGTKGVYLAEIIRSGNIGILTPNGSMTVALTYSCRIANADAPDPAAYEYSPDGLSDELLSRYRRVDELTCPLDLDTGDEKLDLMFRFAKLRAGESIFNTAGGYLHSPGGYSYYAATWCNDQIEYSGPYFAYTGDGIALEAALNAYMEYVPFMSGQYISIPSSVIAEGTDIWERDRGDEAMFAYGASLYALTRGDRTIAEKLYPHIKWCVEYCLGRKNEAGVILSETDELEGRFPSGEANLSTSSLCYGGMRLAAYLARDLGIESDICFFNENADLLESAIESYFGDDSLHGFHTYRYYDGNDLLRSWICLPLCMGIKTRLDGTVDALTSPYLWTDDGLLTQEGSTTVWDRSTLYGFRGAFYAGAGDRVVGNLYDYIERRLLGERVPYAFEAYPEGSKRHLSGESALFCRIITDGILGISPRGLHRFSLTPRLPMGLDHLNLRNIKAFGGIFDIEITSGGCNVKVRGRIIASVPLNAETTVHI